MPLPMSPLPNASISLILPAWNESEVIARAVAEADDALRRIASDYEIIVVDDGSTDDTAAIVSRIADSHANVRLVQHCPNQGYGAAIRSGFGAAQKDLVVFTDADCQFDLTELDRFVLLSQRYDIVCGYRMDRKDTALRCLYSNVYNLMVRCLLGTGVRDVDCALKMFHRDVADQLQLSGNGFLVNSEMLTSARQCKFSIVEVGVSHRPRTAGTSTVSIAHIPKVLASLARYWWNVAQFPSPARSPDRPCSPDSDRSVPAWISDRNVTRTTYGLLLIAAFFLLTNLSYPLIDRDETRYAEIPREMLATGNWVLPQLNFQTYYDKPPLVYWLCAICYRLFGISEASARLVPALSALATIGATVFFGNRLFQRRVGLLAGGVLMLSVGFAFTSRYLLLDGVLAFFVSMSLFTAFEAIRASRVRWTWWIASACFVGLAFLTKGPLAIVLWLPPVFAFAWLSDSHARPDWKHYAVAGAVVAGMVTPWLVAVTLEDPTFLVEFFYTHNVQRFAGQFHDRPIWFFIPILLLAGHPWSFLTIPYVNFLFGRSESVRRRRSPAVGFLFLWAGWAFVFFSLAKCKLPTYLLPAAPALALMLAHYLDVILGTATDSRQHWFARFWSARSATAATCMAGVGLVGFVIMSTGNPPLAVYGWAILWTVLLVASLVMIADSHQSKIAWGSSATVAFLFAVMLMHQMLPTYSHSQTLLRGSSPFIATMAAAPKQAIATVGHEFSEIPFYLNRSDVANYLDVQDGGLTDFFLEHPQSWILVADDVPIKSLQHQLPPGTVMKSIVGHGCAVLIETGSVDVALRVASRPDAQSHVSRLPSKPSSPSLDTLPSGAR
ncbi:Undecaprenyl phosphate-alpha-4-amino-4-deoxy-L-arabinose arabinosyl transferase [Rubripirellula lacrimiformis]|uniref:Undecaprenyl phosphate-alpha-4-amino-4-deoxy-L-arabinose arabinosyl transferase n=1 Tax=Rubripirellula lacrimiformis TaxID=1930273 RepID=A0A517NFM1_9BACT|nr:glycosyltransferase [Rubripirellula lacrimiformis]QDT05915.1 Undecaprenyl phosphate-alpha-4-amino-4-deoxy-L-arabinose arabinosyl transferase [Rubripirellula lacrimiformis]